MVGGLFLSRKFLKEGSFDLLVDLDNVGFQIKDNLVNVPKLCDDVIGWLWYSCQHGTSE